MLIALVAGLAAAALALSSAASAAPPAAAAKTTVVSLTFDDSNADQMTALPSLQANGLHGTFYTISGSIGQPNYLTLPQLQTIYSAGNEIGGHTVNHPDLTLEPADEVQRQVCDARDQLTAWGFPQTSFANPFATTDANVESIIAECGYNSARLLGDIQTPFGCAGCPLAETLPPADPYDLKAPDEVDSTWTLTELENTVLNAETTGGWDILTFHHICEAGCDPAENLSVSPEIFSAFAAWLAQLVASTPSVTVKTVSQVIGGAVKPLVTAPPPPAASGAMANSSLETAVTAGVPSCWSAYYYGTNTPTYAETANAHTGSVAETITMTGYSDGDAKLMPTFDTGGCTPSAAAGHSYQLGAWYESTGVTQFDVYYRTPTGGFVYLTSSPYFPASGTYSHALWTTPELPAGATGISFGLNIFADGTLTTDDYSIIDAATAPALTAMGNASLETAGLGGQPSCWTPTGFGANDGTASETTDAHTGSVAETVSISTYTDGDIKLLPTLDASSCAPAATPGAVYVLGAWYESSTTTQFIAYYRDSSGTWDYWDAGPWLGAANAYTQATWVTPAVPAGATAISFGLDLFGVGTLTTDDYSLVAAS
jgi:peptidoglycan/xylan/chitin deacetylase (PgdA/CDA1 family)